LEFLKKYKKEIFRSIGGLLFVIGFVVHFWITPQKGVSENEIAAANLARMEASVQGKSTTKAKKKPDPSHIAKALKATRQKQMEYMTIFSMILGALFLLGSFIKKSDKKLR